MDADASQRAARQAVQVGLEAAGRVAHERVVVRSVTCDERVTHLGPDFKRSGPDRRPEPRNELCGIRLQRSHGGFEHTADEPAPTRMRHTDSCARTIREHDRQAIGRHHHADAAGPESHGGVGTRRRGPGRGRPGMFDDVAAVHLLEPERLRRQLRCGSQQRTVRTHVLRIVTDVLGEIETRVRLRAQAAAAQRRERVHVRRDVPAGRQP